jgi:hypothetical protein
MDKVIELLLLLSRKITNNAGKPSALKLIIRSNNESLAAKSFLKNYEIDFSKKKEKNMWRKLLLT